MRAILLSCLASSLALCATPSAADPYQSYGHPYAQHNQWDRDAFWQGAGDDIGARINFLQNRIDRAAADGRLNGYQARRLSRTLASIRHDVWQYHGQMTPDLRNNIQWRLDNVGSQIHWQAHRDDADAGHFVTSYDAARDYRDDPRYRERRLSAQDPVYRGSDGRVYCKRSDGTTGLVVGAVGGAAIGNAVSDRHDRTAGTLLGGALGAIVGQQIDQNSDVRCR